MSQKYFNQPSVMSAQQHFSKTPTIEIPRSRFDRSHAYKTTMDAGFLVPVFIDEVLPGDTFDLKATAFARLATPLKPFMDNVYMDVHYFFVPNRLTWNNFQAFFGEQPEAGIPPTTYTVPQALVDFDTELTLARYFGLPLQPGVGSKYVNTLPFRAYCLIWNDWYRDQNTQAALTVPLGDGPDSVYENFYPIRRGKRHDYFTSCLPYPQKGAPVLLPLGTQAPLLIDSNIVGEANWEAQYSGTWTSIAPVVAEISNPAYQGGTIYDGVGGGLGAGADNLRARTAISQAMLDAVNARADLTTATAISVNELRLAVQVQRMLERDARSGTRYVEKMLSLFGVRSPDARLQRPEFLGQSSTRVNVNPIASTVPTEDTPQANLSAVGTAVSRGGFSHSFTEHGFVIGIASIRADLTYQNGVERFWSRQTPNDFYAPPFAHLGEQAVLNKELYFGTDDETNEEVFGYQERWAEYRYKPSRVTGLFSSNSSASLDYWHLCQDFTDYPVLNASFILENPPIDRVIAVPSEPHFLVDFWFDFKCSRPMPVYSVPGLMDHF